MIYVTAGEYRSLRIRLGSNFNPCTVRTKLQKGFMGVLPNGVEVWIRK